MTQNTFSIGDTAQMTGVTHKQIRNWEARGFIPKAERIIYGSRGFRRFTLEQVVLITTIKNLLDQGYTLTTAAAKAADDIRKEKGGK